MREPQSAAPAEGEAELVDGRRVRRERNRARVIDAVLQMFNEELLVPTIEKAAERSGLSLRSVYRYFPDPESLLDAAIEVQMAKGIQHIRLHQIGQGPFEPRVEDFSVMRVRLYEEVAASFRATRHHAPNHVTIREHLGRTRRWLTEQFELQFAPEIAKLPAQVRRHRTINGDLMSQLDGIDLLRRHRRLTVAETIDVVRESVRTALLAPPS